jgi:hypothetical protein
MPGNDAFAAKLFCNVEFWLERLPKLIEPQPEFERPVAAGGEPAASASA